MTTDRSRHGKQGATTPIESAGHPRGLNSETLRYWQSDLEHFVLGIRERLQSLSQSIQNYEIKQQSITQGSSEESKQPGIFSQAPNDEKIPGISFLDREPSPAEHHAGAGLHSAPGERQEDPTDRLNEIKIQLAKQLENK